MLMKAAPSCARALRPLALRFIASVGEPLNPRRCLGPEAFGLPIHDNWWQTETGGIMIANYAAMDIRPARWAAAAGHRGRRSCATRDGDDGDRVEVDDARMSRASSRCARLAVDVPRLPHEEERYRKCFAGGWYLTGDLAMRDADGYFWFVGRADDVIKSAGHLIGPFEVESALMEHPASPRPA
jgi:acetyl-CoA synthetase